MGSGQSSESLSGRGPEHDDHRHSQQTQLAQHPGQRHPRGFHVLRVDRQSPAANAGLQPYFDWIVAVNNRPLREDNDVLPNVLAHSIGSPVQLTVYNARTDRTRPVVVVPEDDVGVGAALRFCDCTASSPRDSWHVLTVAEGSPAERAGLHAETDYIIGAKDFVPTERDSLLALIESSIDKKITLHVFSSVLDIVRNVEITPSRSWGGPGCLGCDIGFGPLHQIPLIPSADNDDQTTLETTTDETHPPVMRMLSGATTHHESDHGDGHDNGQNGGHSHDHDHGHDHGDGHDDGQNDGHSHGHDHGHDHGHGHSHNQTEGAQSHHDHGHDQGHGHSHDLTEGAQSQHDGHVDDHGNHSHHAIDESNSNNTDGAEVPADGNADHHADHFNDHDHHGHGHGHDRAHDHGGHHFGHTH